MGAMALPLLMIGGGLAGGMMLSSMNKPTMPVNNPVKPSVTAAPIVQKSEQDKQNKRINAALLMTDWTQPPKLNKTGLLGW